MPPSSRRQRASRLQRASQLQSASRPQRTSRLNKHQQKQQHVSDEQETVWLADQSTEAPLALAGEDSSADSYAQKLRVLQDQLDKAQTKETKESKIRELVVTIFGFEPRQKQLEALVCIIAEQKDLILIAKKSFGKSLIPQAIPLLLPGKVVICILPLNVIGEECHDLGDMVLHCPTLNLWMPSDCRKEVLLLK